MSFKVADLQNIEEISGKVKLLGGEAGLDNEICGVTIIEAPDIVRFISGGEVLLTGFYAFQSCSVEEFRGYLSSLPEKRVSALAVKRGREVEHLEKKIDILLKFAEKYSVPVLEVPFELSFRDIMKLIMERIFNEEVIRLKYFKTTHDNFTALSLSLHSTENGIRRILDVLEKLIGNPAALFNQNMDCIASTEDRLSKAALSETAQEYDPEFYSNYTYLRQEVLVPGGSDKTYTQYLVRLNVMYNVKMYLAITALNGPLGSMDYIAIENAVTALRQELFRQHSIQELEKKYQNDAMNNLLGGKLHSKQEMERNIRLLGLPADADYRVLVFGIAECCGDDKEGLGGRLEYINALYDAVTKEFPDDRARSDMERVVVIQQVRKGKKQEEYRRELRKTVEKVQKRVSLKNKGLHVRAGAGKEVKGAGGLSDSFREAADSLAFIDILGEDNSDHLSRVMLFSDMGIFKLLCKTDDPDQLAEYIPESLMKLCHYRKHQRQDLLDTLNVYLDRNQNLTKTAQELFIHYKTAAYRIDRITEITGIDFDDPGEVLAVRIGLIVYKMINNLKK